MYKASISDFLEARVILTSLLNTSEDTKVRYGISKLLEKINKNSDIKEFLEKSMDKKVEYAKESEGRIVRDNYGEPELKPERRADYRNWFKTEAEKLTEVEPYIISCETFKDDVFLIEKLNGLLFQVNIEELL